METGSDPDARGGARRGDYDQDFFSPRRAARIFGANSARTSATTASTSSADELAAEQIAKQRRDYMQSIKPQPSFEERVKAEKAKREADAWTKGQEQARAELGKTIMNYACYRGPNQLDINMSDSIQIELKKIRVPAPAGKEIDVTKTDFVATVPWVRAIVQALPDHPRDAKTEVANALNRVRADFAQQAAKKDRNNGW